MEETTIKGRVLSASSNKYTVDLGEKIVVINARGKIKYRSGEILTGDFVEVVDDAISKVYPRTSRFIRPNVANIDTLCITISNPPKPDYLVVDKLLLSASFANVESVIIINKTDLDQSISEYVKKHYSFLNIFCVSAKTGEGMTELENKIEELFNLKNLDSENELIITNIGKREKCKYDFVYKWFNENSLLIDFSLFNESQGYRDQELLELLYENNDDLSKVEKIISLVDPSIVGLNIKKELDYKMNDYFVIYSKHKKSDSSIIEIPFSAESCGTKKMLSLALNFSYSLENGGTLFIDELDSKLHPLLLRYIVQMYTDKSKNKGGGQLIFSSHNLICLDSSDLRRDEIWFVEKNNQKSTMFSLYDFKEETIRKDLDFGKHYLNGRFGAVPFDDEG